MPALITLCYHTGLRIGSIKQARWCDIDWGRETLYIPKTKNGDPITSPLTARCVNELRKLRQGTAEELVFANRHGEPFHHRALLKKIATKAGVPDVTIHWLRHSCGTAMAQAGLISSSRHGSHIPNPQPCSSFL
jgi:integrase